MTIDELAITARLAIKKRVAQRMFYLHTTLQTPNERDLEMLKSPEADWDVDYDYNYQLDDWAQDDWNIPEKIRRELFQRAGENEKDIELYIAGQSAIVELKAEQKSLVELQRGMDAAFRGKQKNEEFYASFNLCLQRLSEIEGELKALAAS
jgi:hypothetical protein